MTGKKWSRIGGFACVGLGALALAVFLRPHTGESETVAATGVSPATRAQRFVVHEWGTFTNFAGSDGVQLDFRPNVEQDLPPFVLNRFRQAFLPLLKVSYRAPLRMETPVTYFYADHPLDVNVSVKFPQGLLTEFYPPVASLGPPYAYNKPSPIGNSFLNWGKVHVIPEAQFASLRLADGKPATLPAVEGDDHYGFARETDSAVVETSDQIGRRHFEKFLFYRGLGNYKLPLTLEARGNDKFFVHNSSPEPVVAMFLVEIHKGQVRYTQAQGLAANSSLPLALPSSADEMPRFCSDAPPSEQTLSLLGREVEAALVATGLYEKEAQSMVKTWQSSWFGEEGTRLFYLVPREQTDAILPLSIEPAPSELVRVLVGRVEVLTPEREAKLRLTMEAAGTCLSASAEPMRCEIEELGRFAEPALEHLARTSADEITRASATRLLVELRQH